MATGISAHLMVAVALALVGAVSFAVAATLHHHAIGESFRNTPTADGGRRLDLGRLWLLVNTPHWLLGTLCAGIGAAVHIVALLLAPVSVIQPVGVLAVPLAVLFAARMARRRPSKRLLTFAAMAVVGIGVFVGLAATHDAPAHQVDQSRALWAAGILAALTVGCVVLGRFGPHRWQCLAWATAAAAGFGLGSSLMRALALLWRDGAGWGRLAVVAALMIVGWAAGAWFAQQAYAAGQPEIVLGALNVVDPLVAVLFGVFVLGEGALLTGPTITVMSVVGALAAVAIVLLSHHHPEARHRQAESSSLLAA